MNLSSSLVSSIDTISEADRDRSSQNQIESQAISIYTGALVAQPLKAIDATVHKNMGPSITSNETVLLPMTLRPRKIVVTRRPNLFITTASVLAIRSIAITTNARLN